MSRRLTAALAVLSTLLLSAGLFADVLTPVPPAERGSHLYERSGQHDANNIRTLFWNYGMVGDYPADPINVDLSVFHSVEVPKGSGLNYGDGITPFVLAKIVQASGDSAFIMETGFRERQGTSPFSNRDMRFEPRPGYFQEQEVYNPGRSPAISSDPRTWPAFWPDRLDDPNDPGWSGAWNGYFGKQVVADQESYTVMDDQYYDAWDFNPDSRDTTRRGLGLRVEVRGFQWANPQARNVIFWHYDITNEGTTDFDDNIIFGLYMDSGVGGSAISCDNIPESDDDNAFYQDEFDGQRINLVYTWDRSGHGRSLNSSCARTGYLGYAYMETPGKSEDGVDNDEDGITDEKRDGGPGSPVVGQDQIRAYVLGNYDLDLFETNFGPLESLPAYLAESWWTGDEDMDWIAENHDVGADGLPDTGDAGEGDGIPTDGEPNFDGTDLEESDQIGLTGFKLNRIRAGQGNPDQEVDGVLFFTNSQEWPRRLYNQFTATNPADRFDPALASNYNIGFLFASGPFKLRAGQTERFSLALAYGADLEELARNTQTVQKIYNANYRFAVPPKLPTVTAEAGDGFVRLSWDDVAEKTIDPVTNEQDFEGYRIYRSTDPDFVDSRDVNDPATIVSLTNGEWITAYDLIDGRSGFSEHVVDGRAEYLGAESGIRHTWTDFSAVNGQQYYYAVTAYDFGSTPEKFDFPPSENAIAPSRTPRGGLVLPTNVVAMRPNPRVLGYFPARADSAVQIAGHGGGDVVIDVVNSTLVPDGHLFRVAFASAHPDSFRATSYSLADSTTQTVLFESGNDFVGDGVGPVGAGLLPVVNSPAVVAIDSVGFRSGSPTNARLTAVYLYGTGGLPHNQRRPGYPDDISIVFHDDIVDTSLSRGVQWPATPAKFEVIAHSLDGDRRLDFYFRDRDANNTLSRLDEIIDVVTYPVSQPAVPAFTWRFTLMPNSAPPTQVPATGDVADLLLTRPLSADDRYLFSTTGEYVDAAATSETFAPYVVPNPYVASAEFEPERFAVSGRGERRLEFRGLPAHCTIRIYNIRGELVQSLQHDGSTDGFVAWDLRTKDDLDVAPGLYIFHVDGGSLGKSIGKFAIIK
jgi:hypothetical protein